MEPLLRIRLDPNRPLRRGILFNLSVISFSYTFVGLVAIISKLLMYGNMEVKYFVTIALAPSTKNTSTDVKLTFKKLLNVSRRRFYCLTHTTVFSNDDEHITSTLLMK